MRKKSFIIAVIISALALSLLTFSLAREKKIQNLNQLKTQIPHAVEKSYKLNSVKAKVQTDTRAVEKQKQFGNSKKSFFSAQNSKRRKVTVSKDLKIKILNKK